MNSRPDAVRHGGVERAGDGSVDFAAFDRRQRRIQRHVLLSFGLGMMAGVLGAVIAHSAFAALETAFNPFAYFLLSAALGASAAGLGWATLSAMLAALTPAVSSIAVATFMLGRLEDTRPFGWEAFALDVTVLAVFACGVMAYLGTRDGLPGDVAAGLLGGALLAGVAHRAGAAQHFWPWPALVVGGLLLGMVIMLRREPAPRLRAVALALAPPAVLILLAHLG